MRKYIYHDDQTEKFTEFVRKFAPMLIDKKSKYIDVRCTLYVQRISFRVDPAKVSMLHQFTQHVLEAVDEHYKIYSVAQRHMHFCAKFSKSEIEMVCELEYAIDINPDAVE